MESNDKECSNSNSKKLTLTKLVKKPFEKIVNLEEYSSPSDFNEFQNFFNTCDVKNLPWQGFKRKNVNIGQSYLTPNKYHNDFSLEVSKANEISKDFGNSLFSEIILKHLTSPSSLPSSKDTTPSHSPPNSPSILKRKLEIPSSTKSIILHNSDFTKSFSLKYLDKKSKNSRLPKTQKDGIEGKKKMHVTNADINVIGPSSW